ncbi:MAG TPA: dihydrofolate reductase family protein [Solirubrobacterales bacterium]|jgi:dihydrofolate reductase
MGRTTFDPAVENEWWPWPDFDVHVLTSRPLPEAGFGSVVKAHADPAAMVAELGQRYSRDVLVLGGPSTVASLLELGAIERLHVLVVPALLGHGLSLAQAPRRHRDLELLDQQTYPDGTVELSYRPR